MQVFNSETINLHTHSFYCGHGSGTIKDYTEVAVKAGKLKVLGFSEHCPTPDLWLPQSRMDYSQLPNYIKDVQTERDNCKSLRILLGAECDWNPRYVSYYKEEILGHLGFDYITGSVHYLENGLYIGKSQNSLETLKKYTDLYIQAIESGLFLFGCHPDLFAVSYLNWDNEAKAASLDIIRCAKENKFPIEINGYGLRKPLIETPKGKRYQYPLKEFWELALEEGCLITHNSDAHRAKDLDTSEDCLNFAAQVGEIKFVSWALSDQGKLSPVQP